MIESETEVGGRIDVGGCDSEEQRKKYVGTRVELEEEGRKN